MGNHRAERGERRTASAGRTASHPENTRNATSGGARRAAAPASRVNDISEVDQVAASIAPTTPGKRARRDIETTSTPAVSIAAPAPLTVEADAVSASHGRVAGAAPAEGGRRRASRTETRGAARTAARSARSQSTGTPLFSLKPSLPVVAGLAALTVSIGGAVFGPGLAEKNKAAPDTVSTMAVSGAAAQALADRDEVVSRDSRRDAKAEADEAELVAAAEAAALEREENLTKVNVRATKQAAKIEANLWHMPVEGYRITATFGLSSYLWSTVHTGLDFAGSNGSPLMAVANGTITEAGYSGSYGNLTVLTLEDGTEIWYAHQSSIGVTVGQKVAGGQVIGALGSTGNSTGPHLHLEVRPGGGDAVNPRTYMEAHGLTP